MAAYARLVTRLRWVLIAFWVAAAITTSLVLPTINEAQIGAVGDLAPRHAEAIETERRAHELFGFPLLSRTIVVQRDPSGLSARAQARAVGRAYALNRKLLPDVDGIAGALPLTNAIGGAKLAKERSTTALTYLFFPPDIGPVGREGLTDRLEKRYIDSPADALVGSTGTISARQEQAALVGDALVWVELATVALVLVAVALHFRCVLAPLVNLATVAIAYLVAIRLIAGIGKAVDVSVPREVTPVIVVLLFGVITDYSIFFLSRFRAFLGDGVPTRAAAERTTQELTPIVSAAGLSVVLASAALLVARLGFLQAFGPGMALAVLIGLAVALTLLPALLAVGGANIFWPSRPARELDPDATVEEPQQPERERRRRSALVRTAVRHPAAVAGGCVLALAGAASGLDDLKTGNPLVRGLPDGNSVKVAYQAASRGFTAGVLAPTVMIVEAPQVAESRGSLRRLQTLLARQPGVAAVAGPGSVPFNVNGGVVVSRSGNAARYVLILSADPLGARAVTVLNRIRAAMPRLLDRVGLSGATASFAGDTALVAETVDRTFADLGRVIPVTALAVFLVLAVFLRALLAPLYLLFASVLAVAAALGLSSYFFVDILGQQEITYYVPFTVAVLLIALGSDYNVFIVGRIWQEARDRPLRDAVVRGGTRAARPIAVAGLILGLSFALLAIVPLRAFREIAFTMTTGLLLDAFVVRTLLVPALITLFGQAGGWPGGRLRARLPARARA
jgi:RND superfamily putative drug exporter